MVFAGDDLSVGGSGRFPSAGFCEKTKPMPDMPAVNVSNRTVRWTDDMKLTPERGTPWHHPKTGVDSQGATSKLAPDFVTGQLGSPEQYYFDKLVR